MKPSIADLYFGILLGLVTFALLFTFIYAVVHLANLMYIVAYQPEIF
jgi:hypothetical protein